MQLLRRIAKGSATLQHCIFKVLLLAHISIDHLEVIGVIPPTREVSRGRTNSNILFFSLIPSILFILISCSSHSTLLIHFIVAQLELICFQMHHSIFCHDQQSMHSNISLPTLKTFLFNHETCPDFQRNFRQRFQHPRNYKTSVTTLLLLFSSCDVKK